VAPDRALQRGDQTAFAATSHREHSMLDILMLALGFGLFAASIGYAYVCERL
jgi:hypothetical protein